MGINSSLLQVVVFNSSRFMKDENTLKIDMSFSILFLQTKEKKNFWNQVRRVCYFQE